jgi:hypothetical protein
MLYWLFGARLPSIYVIGVHINWQQITEADGNIFWAFDAA